MTRVLVGNPEPLRDLVSRHQGPVMFHILQNVRRASLWDTRREVVDDRLERLRVEDLTFDDLASIAVPDEEGEEVHSAMVHLVGPRQEPSRPPPCGNLSSDGSRPTRPPPRAG